MSFSALDRRAREARVWLNEACFPLWASAGLNAHGVFRETLSLDHQPLDTDRTRVRVQARQTYLFAEALRQGWQPKIARRMIDHGLAILCGPVLRADGLAGRILASDARALLDDTTDLYDTAFVLFALAEAHDVLGHDPDACERIAATVRRMLAGLDTHARVATGGFAETLPAPSVRLQNPHMHLLEACLALQAAGLETDWAKATAREIRTLFDTRFTAGQDGWLGEQFASDWGPPSGDAADRVEPGHQFEWVWLLHQYARREGLALPDAALRLYRLALPSVERYGRAVMEITRAGQGSDLSARTWSQTEALKASLALMESTGEESFARDAARFFDVLMDEFLTADGGWHDHSAEDGTPLAQNMPASTGYHVVLALSELIRICQSQDN